jgi:hypothetical protein
MNKRFVVGINGPERQAPLEWAMEQALQADATLFLLHAWQGHLAPELPEPPPTSLSDAELALEHALIRTRSMGIRCDGALHPGLAGHALVSASAGADYSLSVLRSVRSFRDGCAARSRSTASCPPSVLSRAFPCNARSRFNEFK